MLSIFSKIGFHIALDLYLAPNGALAFDVEYARWLEEHNRHISELRAAVNSHAGDTELRTIVDNVTAQFDDIFRLKGIAAKADVFHILSGMWKTPAERCFMWIGGFRSSELLKLVLSVPPLVFVPHIVDRSSLENTRLACAIATASQAALLQPHRKPSPCSMSLDRV
uniref:DOG1 domain-containing protein n=1 Tax=Fagus sylvatica TaxID=28930 RepID=A0A2N9GTB0_FAGSY